MFRGIEQFRGFRGLGQGLSRVYGLRIQGVGFTCCGLGANIREVGLTTQTRKPKSANKGS